MGSSRSPRPRVRRGAEASLEDEGVQCADCGGRAELLWRETWAGDVVMCGRRGQGPRPEPVWAPWGNLAAKEQGGLKN